jgi:hypothetical protein
VVLTLSGCASAPPPRGWTAAPLTIQPRAEFLRAPAPAQRAGRLAEAPPFAWPAARDGRATSEGLSLWLAAIGCVSGAIWGALAGALATRRGHRGRGALGGALALALIGASAGAVAGARERPSGPFATEPDLQKQVGNVPGPADPPAG